MPKKSKSKSSSKSRRTSSKKRLPSLKQAAKWCAVGGLWLFILLGLITAWYASELPELIKSTHFERRPTFIFVGADGSTIDRYGDIKGESVSVKDLPPYLPHAVIATEDRRFYEHPGIDFIGLLRAVGTDIIHAHVVQGGSTITQQLAKNLFLSRERTFKRKVQEALLAVWLEHQLTKDEILSAYLNRVYLGNGAYGVDAAAHVYFGKSAKEVDLREAAILAGMLKAPARYSPESNPGLAAKRAAVVLNSMAEAGYITKQQAKRETLSIPTPKKKPVEGGGVHYFTDWVASSLDELAGTSEADMKVYTTLDPFIELQAETILSRVLRENGPDAHFSQGAIIVMDRSGAIRAMVGGRNYNENQFNRAVQAMRQTGSSFKPIVYLTALERGATPDDMIDSSPITTGRYRPGNYNNEYYGMVTFEQALAHSLNTAAVRLAQQIGIGNVIMTARRLGIRADLEPNLSTALGSNGVPMLEMLSAYGVFANGGRSVNPYGIYKIVDSAGNLLYQRDDSADGLGVFDSRPISELDSM
ncbi:MAG TPA: transglycosylase domain-containing protein, partial [Patescibacteria group bacterium]|nr:transglycosylase domain-containing protein [Patescibacteria group bacterium]